MNKYNFNTRVTYYQKARFFRKTGSNEYAYCIEPFQYFQENEVYEETPYPYNLDQQKIDRISRIAYYGYGYQDHTDPKWYAITQMMIWQAADGGGNYYFSETLNGARANLYNWEITQINNLVEESNIKPSFQGKEYWIVEGNNLILEDQNAVLKNYHSEEGTIEGNKLILENLTEGDYHFKITKNRENRKSPLLFYQSSNSQNLVKGGAITEQDAEVRVIVTKTSIEIKKIDKDTQSTTPQKGASLDGAIYEITKEDGEKVGEITIENGIGILENLDFGKYTIKEIKAGEGYTINPEEINIEITEEEPNIHLELENEIIKGEVIIEKVFGEENNFNVEENISFWIKDKEGSIIETITTNEEGKAYVLLPYGNYTIEQINTTEGYEKIEPLTIKITEDKELLFKLKDYKIEVPDTHTEKKNPYLILLQILWILLL